MNLITNTTENYQLTLTLNVSYEQETISTTVTFWDRRNHATEKIVFHEGQFSAALACYRSYEKEYFNTQGGHHAA